jgi:bacteriocin-like protein
MPDWQALKTTKFAANFKLKISVRRKKPYHASLLLLQFMLMQLSLLARVRSLLLPSVPKLAQSEAVYVEPCSRPRRAHVSLLVHPLTGQSSGQIQKYPGVNRGIFFKKRNGFRLELELCYNHTTQVIRRKTLMDLKNLMSHVVRPVKPTTKGELPGPELAQLSEEDLQQIIGGSTKNPKQPDVT